MMCHRLGTSLLFTPYNNLKLTHNTLIRNSLTTIPKHLSQKNLPCKRKIVTLRLQKLHGNESFLYKYTICSYKRDAL